MNNILLKIIKKHLSSFSLVLLFISAYIYGGHDWVNSILPINGKPLAVFTLLGLSLVYELTSYSHKKTYARLEEVARTVEVGQLTTAINSMYFRFVASGDESITNEYTIREIGYLEDTRERLQINSYVQGRLEYLQSKIKTGGAV